MHELHGDIRREVFECNQQTNRNIQHKQYDCNMYKNQFTWPKSVIKNNFANKKKTAIRKIKKKQNFKKIYKQMPVFSRIFFLKKKIEHVGTSLVLYTTEINVEFCNFLWAYKKNSHQNINYNLQLTLKENVMWIYVQTKNEIMYLWIACDVMYIFIKNNVIIGYLSNVLCVWLRPFSK